MTGPSVALLCLALMLTACREEEAAAPPPVRPVLSVVVEAQARGGQAFTGVVEPQYQADLGFRLLGRVIARAALQRQGSGRQRHQRAVHRCRPHDASSSIAAAISRVSGSTWYTYPSA